MPATGGLAGSEQLAPLVDAVLASLDAGRGDRDGPISPGGPATVRQRVRAALGGDPLPEHGVGPLPALHALVEVMAWGSADPLDPRCAAHLHCPPLAVAVAADLAVSALNPSLDSWDQAPAGVSVETEVIAVLAALAGFPATAGGSVTSGGTESNLMGLLLAREHHGCEVAVVCSAAAHFSIRQAARLIGLADTAVTALPAEDDRLDPTELDRVLGGLARPAAVVATAGTTDLGSIDPIGAVVEVAARHGAWVHVDAAFGGGALFSDRLRPLLSGLDGAHTIALDLHKLGWQPVPAGVFLARDESLLQPLHRRAAYLNPADDEEAGFAGRLAQSLRTTRRPDALKLAATFRALGRTGLGALVERCHDLAHHAASRLAHDPRFELAEPPVLPTVVFRYIGCPDELADEVNASLRRALLHQGRAVVGRTERYGRTYLKLTLLNPHATTADVDALLAAVAHAGTSTSTTAPEPGHLRARAGAA